MMQKSIPITLYLDAVNAAARRSRTVWVLTTITCLLIFAGMLASAPFGSGVKRLERLENIVRWHEELKTGRLPSPDCTGCLDTHTREATLLEYQSAKRLFDKHPILFADPARAEALLQDMAKSHVLLPKNLPLPFVGAAIDASDLSNIAFSIFLTLLIIQIYCLLRERENLDLTLAVADERKQLTACKKLIRMKQVFYIPAGTGKRAAGSGNAEATDPGRPLLLSLLMKYAPVAIFFLPFLTQAAIAWSNYSSNSTTQMMHYLQTAFMGVIFVLGLCCVLISSRMDSLWALYPEHQSEAEELEGSWTYKAIDRQQGLCYRGTLTVKADENDQIKINGCRREKFKCTAAGEPLPNPEKDCIEHTWNTTWVVFTGTELRFGLIFHELNGVPKKILCDLVSGHNEEHWEGSYFQLLSGSSTHGLFSMTKGDFDPQVCEKNSESGSETQESSGG